MCHRAFGKRKVASAYQRVDDRNLTDIVPDAVPIGDIAYPTTSVAYE